MISLRPDQEQFVRDLRAALASHQAVLGCAATGFGKTVVSAFIVRSAQEKGKRVIFSVHRRELLLQTAKTFRDVGINFGFIQAGLPYDDTQLVHIASIDTLRNRLDLVKQPDLLVVDECHLAMAEGWQKVIKRFKAGGAKVVGNSGSPDRLDGRPLSDIFGAMVVGPPPRWLMDNGHLSGYRYFCPTIPSMRGVKRHMGDFAKGETEKVMRQPTITGDILGHWKGLAKNKRTIAFCVSISHSQHLAEAFMAAGVQARHIDGSTPRDERHKVINEFADGLVQVLCSVELITTGFDLSSQVGRDVPVEAVIMARPTQSLALYLQMVGRALRRKPEPAIILDHAGNAMRHGLPDDDREWTLAGSEKGRAKADNDNDPGSAIKVCTSCFAVHKPAPVCPACGHVYPNKPRELEHQDGELVEITPEMREAMKRAKQREVSQARTLPDLIKLAEQRGHSKGWAFKVFQSRERRRA